MAAFHFGMGAFGNIRKEIAKDACAQLYQKYGEPFSVVKIGEMLDTDHAKLYVHPDADETLLFVAYVDKETREVTDGYVERRVTRQVETILREAFRKEGMEVSSRCRFVSDHVIQFENNEYTPRSFAEAYGIPDCLVYLAIEDTNASVDTIRRAIIDAEQMCGIRLLIAAYTYHRDSYLLCEKDINEYPDMSGTMFALNNPTAFFRIAAENGVLSLTAEEIASAMEGGN